MKQSRTVAPPAAVESLRYVPLVDLLVEARAELFELAVRSGLRVLETMLEGDRTALCGPRYAHVTERRASRAGTVRSEVVIGGRTVARPRGEWQDAERALKRRGTAADGSWVAHWNRYLAW